MKKIVLIPVLFFALAAAVIYILYSAQLNITQNTLNDVSENNASRFLTWKKNWQRWWPGQKNGADSTLLVYKGVRYNLLQSTNSGMFIQITNGDAVLKSEISYLAEDNLKVKITWTAEMSGSKNVLKRLEQHQLVWQVADNMAELLRRLQLFLSDEHNVYGFNIHLSKVKDPVMLATSKTVTGYPGVAVIYPMIDSLKQLIKDQNGTATNNPMLNINRVSKTTYQVMVAIPIKKELKPAGNIVINRMVAGGNILEADVKGGPNTIEDAFAQVKNFSRDYKLTAPAMPFESLVTDRSLEKDTAKWITKIYYPIF